MQLLQPSRFFRKVNGIEKVIMPKLRNTETYIMMEMDERVNLTIYIFLAILVLSLIVTIW